MSLSMLPNQSANRSRALTMMTTNLDHSRDVTPPAGHIASVLSRLCIGIVILLFLCGISPVRANAQTTGLVVDVDSTVRLTCLSPFEFVISATDIGLPPLSGPS